MHGMARIIGLDLGGTTVNVTAWDGERFVINEMTEVPSLVKEGPDSCLAQLESAFHLACTRAGFDVDTVAAIGLDSPGPISADGIFGDTGPTNFNTPGYKNFDLRGALEKRLLRPVSFLNDGNAAGLYAHWTSFGSDPDKTSLSLIIGTGLGGGIVAHGRAIVGRKGFAAELGHVRLPADWNPEGLFPARCNCGKENDLESIASLTGLRLNVLPHLLAQHPEHPLAQIDIADAAKQARGLADAGDELCRKAFRLQTRALGAHIDQMINTLDMDAVFIGGGGVQASESFRSWFIDGIRESVPFRREQADLPIAIIPDGDMAGARGSAIYAMQAMRGQA